MKFQAFSSDIFLSIFIGGSMPIINNYPKRLNKLMQYASYELRKPVIIRSTSLLPRHTFDVCSYPSKFKSYKKRDNPI